MLLRALRNYAVERLKLPPPSYSRIAARYVVLLDGQGRLLSVEPIDRRDPKTKRIERMVLPYVLRTSAIRANLINDNAEYVFGMVRERGKEDRACTAHQLYVELLRRCADATEEPSVRAVLSFIESEPLKQLQLPDDFDSGGVISFRVDGMDPTELPTVREFWSIENAPPVSSTAMNCLVCGSVEPVLLGLREPFKPVPGGQSSGTWIGAAGPAACSSYGLEAGRAAPTCPSCAEAFTYAANTLLSASEERVVMGGAAFIFWTREDVGFSFRDWFDQPKPEEVRALLESVKSGGPRPEIDETAFYATALSGSGARTVVREWIDITVGQAKAALATWFEDQAVVERDGADGRPLGLYPLAAATVRDASKELAPPTIRALLRTALTETPAPFDLLARAVRRNRAEGTVTHPRAALVKLVLARQGMSREEVHQMTQLVPDHPSPAYQCGRLLAILDAIQRAALGSVNATVVDRYFGTASSAPGAVFPYLIRGSAPHLAKLRKARPGVYQALQQRMEEVMDQVPDFKPVLTLRDQGLFSLGFYHQRADDRRRAREAAERRRTGPTQGPNAADQNATDAAEALTEEELGS